MLDTFIFLLSIIGLCGFILLFIGKNKKAKDGDYYINEVDSLDVSREEFYKVLNFMLIYGVITNEEYMGFQTKGLSNTR